MQDKLPYQFLFFLFVNTNPTINAANAMMNEIQLGSWSFSPFTSLKTK